MTIAIVAEKPSVARDLGQALGATRRGNGTLLGNGYVITWAIGHLVGLAEPEGIRPEWRRWRREDLPLLPDNWPLTVFPATLPQFEIVRDVMNAPGVQSIICATDAGREGELIFRLIYEAAGCRRPVSRLWISSLTESAIQEGLRKLRPARDYDDLASAALARSRADWLVGMNLSRAYGLALDAPLSVGRVQTPTLAMLVERELSIRDFVPEEYLELVGTFSGQAGPSYRGTWFRPGRAEHPERLARDGEEARVVLERVLKGEGRIASSKSQTKKLPPPLLYDLTELQRHANRLYGFSAQRTLEVAQALYEKHKLLSYPRTDSRHLSSEIEGTLGPIVATISEAYRGFLADGSGQRPLARRFVDDAKVTDHHAIIPTANRAARLNSDEQRVYDLVCRRLLQAWHDDFVWAASEVITEVHAASGTPPCVDSFRSRGTAIEQLGWKVLDIGEAKAPPRKRVAEGSADGETAEAQLPPGLKQGQVQRVLDAKLVPKVTRPPPRLTDASLLTAMETAGKTLDERELSDAMKENGLGTPATRASIIETLIARGYVSRDGKALHATDRGMGLIEVVDAEVKSAAMTGAWEARLARVARGQGKFDDFMEQIEAYVAKVVARVPRHLPGSFGTANDARPTKRATSSANDAPVAAERSKGHMERGAERATPSTRSVKREPVPATAAELHGLLRDRFGFEAFRAQQQAVCEAAARGEDVLLVMPTGAGKSLCYQLPGLARGGTTLVLSPLIALIEDQVARLQSLGFHAERIHSGRGRVESRKVCADYVAGQLDFLFIAPERLGVQGFPELLARRQLSLIAIDEAHCISQWGHDFRPDYRLLGQRLPMLRPAPVVALTATATPVVQDDIVAQLGLNGRVRRFIHGFRRHNLALEVLEVPPKDRAARVLEWLSNGERLPAIVYAATRKSAEDVARVLGSRVSSAAYHAGLPAEQRERVQSDFLAGKLDVVVATVAFGMGVDKSNIRTVLHLALPASVESYYQEIGRAGRDGKPSRTVLMHHVADRKTHDFFLERDYPDQSLLEKAYRALGTEAQDSQSLRKKTRIPKLVFAKVLEKLSVHGGALGSRGAPDDRWVRGHDAWRVAYAAQRALRQQQIELIAQFAARRGCRMLGLIAHFGDTDDSGAVCGLCDSCAPEARIGAPSLLRPAAKVRSSIGAKGGRRKKSRSTSKVRRVSGVALPKTGADAELVARLRAWRLQEAKRQRVPAFRILTNRALLAIAQACPESAEALSRVKGAGPKLLLTYGPRLVSLCVRG